MKTIIIAALLISASPVFAVEGLHLSIQSSNAVLSWPSDYDSGETFLVQYRQTLNATDAWQTLADYLPAAYGTNFTFFVHSNSVHYPPAGSGGGTNNGNISPFPFNSMAMSAPVPLVMPANGTGAAVPLALYPPGMDLSGFTIFDPATGESVSGKGYVISTPPVASRRAAGFQPMGEEEEVGDTNQYTGFYRVVRDGVHLYGLTNGMEVSNVLETVIEFAVDSTDQVVGVTFYDANTTSPIAGASAQNVGGNRWLLVWNTLQTFNGDYALCAKLNFASDEPVVSQPVTVTVNNPISFPNYFSTVFGGEMWIYAQTIPNAPYGIDLYDENTNYLGSFDDYADGNGTISFVWDLTDGNGHTFDDTNFFGVFTVTNSSLSEMRSPMAARSGSVADFQTASRTKKYPALKMDAGGAHPNDVNSIASARQMWVKEGSWAPNNTWVVAYAPLTTDSTTTYKESLMMLGGPDGNEGGVIGILSGNDFHGSLSPGNVPQTLAFALSDAATRTDLLSYLADHAYENFYFFGHGNDSQISAYQGSGTVITGDNIAFALGNVPLSFAGPPQLINIDPPIMVYPTVNPLIRRVAQHPYRFVFLDGCETGGGLLCESFGIPALTVSTNFFAAAGVESRAFLGYTQEISFNVAQWDWRAFMIGGFLTDWESDQLDLQTCVGNAQAGIYSQHNQPMDSSAIIYGAFDMRFSTRTRP